MKRTVSCMKPKRKGGFTFWTKRDKSIEEELFGKNIL